MSVRKAATVPEPLAAGARSHRRRATAGPRRRRQDGEVRQVDAAAPAARGPESRSRTARRRPSERDQRRQSRVRAPAEHQRRQRVHRAGHQQDEPAITVAEVAEREVARVLVRARKSTGHAASRNG